ncbi:hypothetical protein DFP73DRAFT_592798 [Morchella snyderi]|nr:hypothetical protein DFP73DRAFT_592798 [Morchella snyderi]
MPKATYKSPLPPTPSPSPPRSKRTRRLYRHPPPPTTNWAATRALAYAFVRQTLIGLALGYVLFLLVCACESVPDRRGLVGRESAVKRWEGQEKVEWGEKVKWGDSEEGAVW